MKTYSTSGYRIFKKFVGELTAAAAGAQIGTNLAVKAAAALANSDPWYSLGAHQGIHVCGLNSPTVQISTARLNIVSLYSGFDLFLAHLRSQHFQLHNKEWRQHDGDSPFDEIQRNSSSTTSELKSNLNPCRISTIDYYRLVRNAVAHPSADNIGKAKMFFFQNAPLLTRIRSHYGMISAPNDYDQLSYHDVKAFAQTALDLCQAIDIDFDPGDQRLALQIPECLKREQKSDARIRNTIAGWLRNNYSISGERTDRITTLYMTHQLAG